MYVYHRVDSSQAPKHVVARRFITRRKVLSRNQEKDARRNEDKLRAPSLRMSIESVSSRGTRMSMDSVSSSRKMSTRFSMFKEIT